MRRREVIPKAGSPGECAFALHCRVEKLNPVREYRFHHERMWRFDFAFIEQKIAVEIEGGVYSFGRHSRGKGNEADMDKYNQATILGWRVLRYSTGMAMSGQAILEVVDLLGK